MKLSAGKISNMDISNMNDTSLPAVVLRTVARVCVAAVAAGLIVLLLIVSHFELGVVIFAALLTPFMALLAIGNLLSIAQDLKKKVI